MTFQKGQSGNPSGRKPGRQAFVDRANNLLDGLTVGELKKHINDERKFDELPAFDGMILRRVAEALTDGGRASMDSLLDRLIGKPTQTTEVTGGDGGPIRLEDTSPIEIGRRLAFLLAAASHAMEESNDG